MGSNTFGTHFRVTTWGESHGEAIGAVIDGCPAGLPLTEHDINLELDRRRGGQSPYTTPRAEPDRAEILSGVFEGVTTGAPISLLIRNRDADPSKYEATKHLLRPGHANYTYLEKYGVFDYRGGGRASARETAARVAAGAVAKKLLAREGIVPKAYISELGGIPITTIDQDPNLSPLFCPDSRAEAEMIAAIEEAKAEGDSLGGIVACTVPEMPTGLGEPIFEKLEAQLAHAMLTIPATKGFEIGAGFEAARMRGSEHNDLFCSEGGKIRTRTNHAGGVLGGISNGMPLTFRVAFKPPSSLPRPQETVDLEGNPALYEQPPGSRHDPCVAIRAVPVVEAMTALTLLQLLYHQTVPPFLPSPLSSCIPKS